MLTRDERSIENIKAGRTMIEAGLKHGSGRGLSSGMIIELLERPDLGRDYTLSFNPRAFAGKGQGHTKKSNQPSASERVLRTMRVSDLYAEEEGLWSIR